MQFSCTVVPIKPTILYVSSVWGLEFFFLYGKITGSNSHKIFNWVSWGLKDIWEDYRRNAMCGGCARSSPNLWPHVWLLRFAQSWCWNSPWSYTTPTSWLCNQNPRQDRQWFALHFPPCDWAHLSTSQPFLFFSLSQLNSALDGDRCFTPALKQRGADKEGGGWVQPHRDASLQAPLSPLQDTAGGLVALSSEGGSSTLLPRWWSVLCKTKRTTSPFCKV